MQCFLLLPSVLIVFWDVVSIKPPKPKEISKANEEVEGIQCPDVSKVKNESLAFYIEELCEASGESL